MLKKITQAKTLTWQEIDLHLNSICDHIITNHQGIKNISYSEKRDKIPASILSEKLGYSLSDYETPHDINFSIFSDSNRILENNISLSKYCFYFITHEFDKEYQRNVEPTFSLDQFEIPHGETVFKLSLPWDKRW